MKRLFISIIIMLLTASFAFARQEDEAYFKFNFNEGLNPEFSALSGEWELGNKADGIIKKYTFDDREQDFLPLAGSWSFSDGKYIQSQTGFSALTRSMLPKSYSGFIINFSAVPLSEDNTLMIYFGSKSGNDGCSIEINGYQSKLIMGGEEFFGIGGIEKGQTYNIRLLSEKNRLTLFCDGKVMFNKTDMPEISGRVGIGSWNSAFAFDDFSAEQIPSMGTDTKLVGRGKSAAAVFPELAADNFTFSGQLAAENIQDGRAGIVVRASENGDGYYLGTDADSAFILKKSGIGFKTVEKAAFKARSGKMYDFKAVCDGDRISLFIDGKEIVSARDKSFAGGMCGFFEEKTAVYCKNAAMSILIKESPPVFSEGDTVYYIDSENGNDLNDGKSEKTAWQSVYKLRMCRLEDGDTILLKCGRQYAGTLALEGLKPDKSILISSYGEGERPVITACGKGVLIKDCSNITLSGLDIRLRHYASSENSELGQGCGAELVNSPDITITDCNFTGPGDKSYTAAVKTDSIFNEPSTENVLYSGFGINAVSVNGEEITNDGEQSGHWAYKYMKRLMQKNIISEYRPDDNITRAEFSSMLVSALGLDESEYRGIFKDITADMWYAKKIQTVSDYRYLPPEMTDGENAGALKPLNRAELAAMSALASGKISAKAAEFNDIDECEPWMLRYIGSAAENGIMSGDPDGNFNPYKEVTRAEACVVLTKLMEIKEEQA